MAGKEEKLRVYGLAKQLAVKLTQAATSVDNLPQSIAYIIITGPIGVMADIMIGSNTKYLRRRLGSYCRAALRTVKCQAAIEVVRECNWVEQEEYEDITNDVETLSKMLWGLVKNIRKSAEEKAGDSKKGENGNKVGENTTEAIGEGEVNGDSDEESED